MSSGGRLILVNACWSSIPTCIMGFYDLSDGQHKELDNIRGRFFWQGGGKTCKYHMAKMRYSCHSKRVWRDGNPKYKNDERLFVGEMDMEIGE
jgi:hypothetical protein